jgi:hypothetical protein
MLHLNDYYKKSGEIGNKKNKAKIKTKLSNIVKDWGDSTSLHGVGQGFKATSIIIKILWYLLTLACLGYCVYTSYVQVINYLKYGVVTSIKEVYEAPARFPAVTICNLNGFDSSQISSVLDQSEEFMSETGINTSNNAFNEATDIRTLIKSFIIANYTDEMKKNFTFDLEEILIYCSFGGIYNNLYKKN